MSASMTKKLASFTEPLDFFKKFWYPIGMSSVEPENQSWFSHVRGLVEERVQEIREERRALGQPFNDLQWPTVKGVVVALDNEEIFKRPSRSGYTLVRATEKLVHLVGLPGDIKLNGAREKAKGIRNGSNESPFP